MATVRVRALARIHGLKYGEEATIERTPMVDLLISSAKLAEIVDAPFAGLEGSSTIVDEQPPVDEAPDEPTQDPDPEPEADQAPPRTRKQRGGRSEEPDAEVT